MKKQNKKERQVQVKSWKVWFYTLWLPVIIYIIFLFILLSLRIVNFLSAGCNPDDEAYESCIFSESMKNILMLIYPSVPIFLLYHLFYFVFRLFFKKNYFSWKIFLGTMFILFLIIFLFKIWST